MTEPLRCQRCGKPLPQNDVLSGRCPHCLLQLGFDSGAGGAEDPEPAIGPPDPAAIGRYRILRRIGEGGMGVVYEAEQDHPRRTVALKIIKPNMASPELLRRFEQESQALGRLQHPGIAQIYEAGTVDTGFGPQPYFAMELIRGSSPREYAEAHQLGTRERLEIMAKICDAVHHAHQRGLIHRDLKPGNILIDESGQPKILDFGVARVTDSDARATLQTDVGKLIGTLAYMSPEQVLADPLDIDTRSDVYSLGVILYEFLSGHLPYPISNKIHETIQSIREEDPDPLSGVNRTLRGDIETIVLKALEKDRARRYASAAEMAADIRRYLKYEPIVARPASASYQLRKFARRNRALVVGVVAVFAVLVAGVAVSTWQASRAMRSDQEARIERDNANDSKRAESQARLRETEQRNIAEAALVKSEVQTLIAQQALSDAQVNLYFNDIVLADKEWATSSITNSDQFLREAPELPRNWEWYYLTRRNHMEEAVMSGHRSPIGALAWIADGKILRTVSTDYTYKDWDIQSRKEIASGRFERSASGNINVMDLSANGQTLSSRLVSTINGISSVIYKFWDLSTGKEVFSFPDGSSTFPLPERSPLMVSPDGRGLTIRMEIAGRVPRVGYGPVVISPDGNRFVANVSTTLPGASRYRLRSLEIRTGRELVVLGEYEDSISGLSFNPDGTRLAVIGNASTKVLNGSTGQLLVTLEDSQGTGVSVFSHDDAMIAAGIRNGGMRAWKGSDGKKSWTISDGIVSQIVFSPDSRLIAAAFTDHTIHILDSATGRETDLLKGHKDGISALTFTPDSSQLLSAGDDKLIRIWNLKARSPGLILDAVRIPSPLRLSPDGKTLVTSTASGLKSWDTNTGKLGFELPTTTSAQTDFSPDGAGFILLDESKSRSGETLKLGGLQVIDAHTGRELAVLHPPKTGVIGQDFASEFRISPGHDRAALVSTFPPPGQFTGSETQLWEVATGTLITSFRLDKTQVLAFRFAKTGKLAALGTLVNEDSRLKYGIEIYDTTTGSRLRKLDADDQLSYSFLTFSPDGDRLTAVAGARTIMIWDVRTGARLRSFTESDKVLSGIAFSPDGSRVVSISTNSDVWLWDAISGKPLIPLRESSGPYAVREATVIGEGIASAYRLPAPGIQTASRKELAIFFSPDGRQINLTTITPDPKGINVRIETWDGTPRP